MPSSVLLRNFDLLDAEAGELRAGYQLLARGKTIAAVEKGEIGAAAARVIDLGGRVLMPGLIDCHVHILHRYVQQSPPQVLPSFVTAHAGEVLRGMLMRGFTTVRDCAGADLGHKQAVEAGLFAGPRLFISGRALSQTGGHGDPRSRAELQDPCACPHLGVGISRIADGVAEVRRAVRDEIRLGADQIKIMAGGGVSTPADPLDQLQYSADEMKAVADEARRSHTYVAAHVYTAEGIQRAVEAGIRTIEHGNMIDETAAATMARAGAILVPTLITYRKLIELGAKLGKSAYTMEKARMVLATGTRSLEIAKRAGVEMAYGTDLLWAPEHACEEFLVRAEVLTPAEVIRSATATGARLLRREGILGVIKPGASADLIAVNGNPLADLGLFQGQGRHIPLVMKEGTIHKLALPGA